ncbi:MAG: peptidoglycan DD-metalloendopeptidase family protein [Candidatus Paceibacterota bacterium]
MAMAFMVIMVKGSASEGQRSVFSNLLTRYIDETAASVVINPSQSQLADINSVIAHLGNDKVPSPSTLSTIQGNSVVSHGTIVSDILNEFTDRGTQVATYTVQEGDALSFIASDYGVSIDTIIWANNLKNADSIKPGLELKIPPVSGVIHKVTKGDTVSSIAKKYGVEASEIISFNLLPQDASLQLNQELIVPDGKLKSVTYSAQVNVARSFAYLPILDGYFMQPTTGYNWGRIHGRNGVDIANSCYTDIYAAAEGNVVTADSSGYNGGFGKFIKIVHPNGTETVYAHASSLLVSAGEYVGKGQHIAEMGSTGNSTGCHLHFEVHGARNPMARF